MLGVSLASRLSQGILCLVITIKLRVVVYTDTDNGFTASA